MLLAAVILALHPPVPGTVVRGFEFGADPFAGGQHRGVDFAVRPGAAVRAPCRGEVVAAGAVAGVDVVSLRCDRHRVSLLPLADVAVEPGARVGAGEPVGVAAGDAAHAVADHAGAASLHLGVRREGDPFGYVDPLPLLGAPAPAPSPPVRTPPPVRPPKPPRPAPPAPPAPPHPAAPWPTYAGLGLVLAGLTTTAARGRARRRRKLARSRAWSRASA